MRKRIGIRILLIAVATAAPAAAQDAFGYTVTSSVPFAYQNVSGTGTGVLGTTDDANATIALPFNFRFYGSSYSSVCVSTNGLLSFGSCVDKDFTNLDLTLQSPTGNQPLIAPFWSDLSFAVPGAGAVYYQSLGAVGTRQFVIQWNNAYGMNTPGSLNFQAVLCEGTNRILFQYQNVESGSAAVSKGKSATVGIRGPSGNTNNQRSQWSYNSAVLSNNMAIQFNPPATAAPVDVTSSFTVTTTTLIYNAAQKTYSTTVTIKAKSSVNRPLTVVLSGLPPGAAAVGASGTAPGLGPFYNVAGTGPMAANESANIPVVLTYSGTARLTMAVKVYSGSF